MRWKRALISTETDGDQLTVACSKRMAIFLLFLKEMVSAPDSEEYRIEERTPDWACLLDFFSQDFSTIVAELSCLKTLRTDGWQIAYGLSNDEVIVRRT